MKALTGICIALLAGISVAGCSPDSTTAGDDRATSQTTTSEDRAASQASTNDQRESPPIVQSPTAEPSTTSDMAQQARVFEVLDQDRDGYVSKLEASDRVDDYDQADANNDGRLDRQEFSAIELKDIDDNASTPTPTQP
jgi:hypothetical protein